MDKLKVSKGRMYHSSDLVLDKYSSSFAEHEELCNAHQELKRRIATIDVVEQGQLSDNKGLTQYKAGLRVEVTQIILKFSTALKAFATVQKSKDLLNRASFLASDLARISDPTLFNLGMMLYNLADPLREQLAKFFLTEQDYKRAESLLADFKAAIPQRRMASTVSISTSRKMTELFQSLDRLLKEQIDLLVTPFKYDHPDFYREYTIARKVVSNMKKSKGKSSKENLDAITPEMV
jgi:hypothetical protein